VALGDRLVGRDAVPPSAVIGRVRRLFHLCVLALFPFTYPLAQSPQPAPRDDTQNWNEVEIAKPLNRKVDLEFYGQLRLGRNLNHFVDERVGVGFSFKPNKHLNLEPSYRYIAAQPVAGMSTREHRLSFEATVSVPFRGFTLSDRNLVDRRLRSSGNTTQYRNRLQLEHPLKLGGFEATLFASDEVFYDSRERAWIRNRFSLGLSRKFSDRYVGEIYYLRQNDGFSRPGDLHVIGTTLRVRFK
jgi:hypothetical protein